MLKFLLALLIALPSLLEPIRPPEIWATPIPDFDARHSWDYSLPATEYGAGHRGVDLYLEPGEEITSPFDAVVTFAGKVVDRNLITLQSLTGYKASFEVVCTHLSVGEFVLEGEVIGKACDGDLNYQIHCENCVHFSVRTEHGYLNPLLFLGSIWPSHLVS